MARKKNWMAITVNAGELADELNRLEDEKADIQQVLPLDLKNRDDFIIVYKGGK